MDQIIEFYAKKEVSKNDGYNFIKTDYAYVPIMQTYLSVTKRDYYSLPLLDEIVLRLIDEGVHDIDELVYILGIDRKLLEITLADLYVKDLIYCTANSCSLQVKGRRALSELRIIQKSKECLKNVYLDPINEKVILDYDKLTLLEKVYDDDRKLEVEFEIKNINVFRKNVDNIKKVFSDETSIFNDKTKAQPAELLSIDSVEKVYVKFVKVPFYVYVSENGFDIDIMSADSKTEYLLQQFKKEIIAQIRNHKLLRKVFTKFPLKRQYDEINLSENKCIKDLARKYFKEKEEKDEVKKELEKNIFMNRKLQDNEFDILYSFLVKAASNVVINVDCLDDWCYGNDFFVSVLSKIGAKKNIFINYCEVKNLSQCTRGINRTIQINTKDINKASDLPYISIILDSKWRFTSVPKDIKIIDEKTHIYKLDIYFEVVE